MYIYTEESKTVYQNVNSSYILVVALQGLSFSSFGLAIFSSFLQLAFISGM